MKIRCKTKKLVVWNGDEKETRDVRVVLEFFPAFVLGYGTSCCLQ